MKIQKNLSKHLARFFFGLLVGVILIPNVWAQSKGRPIENRYLLIFNTSSAMKKRLPGEEKAIKELFALTLNGQFRPGDTIGVWTFSKDLRTGQYPLEHWEPQDVVSAPLEIFSFVKNQHYSKTTSFDTMMQLLNQVVLNSPRLTTVIFCDGEADIKGTPYDAAINGVFKENQSIMEKTKLPFIIVLRSQFGKYIGFTINTPNSINLPQFPPLVQPVTVPPVNQRPPHPAPAQPAPPPLIIIGNNAGTNPPAPVPMPAPSPAAPANPVPQSQSAPVAPPGPVPLASPTRPPVSASPAPETNPAPQAATEPVQTNAVVAATKATIPPAVPANVANTQPGSSSPRKGGLFIAGALLLVAAGGSAILVFRSRGRHSPSLITESLKKR